jgi:hypothetical protein
MKRRDRGHLLASRAVHFIARGLRPHSIAIEAPPSSPRAGECPSRDDKSATFPFRGPARMNESKVVFRDLKTHFVECAFWQLEPLSIHMEFVGSPGSGFLGLSGTAPAAERRNLGSPACQRWESGDRTRAAERRHLLRAGPGNRGRRGTGSCVGGQARGPASY